MLSSGVVAASGLGVAAACAEARAHPAPPSGSAGPPRSDPSFVEARDGTRLFVRDWGTGAPIVFLHAWGLSADAWEYQMLDLADQGVRCVACDRRGHARSGDPGRGHDFDTLADDLASVLDALDLHGVTLVGHSMGGGEAARYLARHGTRRIARAVLVSAITPVIGRRPDFPQGSDGSGTEALIAAFKHDRPAAIAAGLPLFTGTRDVSPALQQWLLDQFLRASPHAAIEFQRAILAADFRPDMAAFTIPTMIVHGDDDRVNPLERTGRATAQAIRGSQLVVYEGAPHGLPITDKVRFNRDLLAFARG